MRVARVVGSVVATVKLPALAGRKLLLVEDVRGGEAEGSPYVAVDAVGAGVGSTVLVVQGTPAAWISDEEGFPVDAAVVAILDDVPAARPGA